MNRFTLSSSSLNSGEILVETVAGTRLYDGDKKTEFEDGYITLTSFRLLWRHPNQYKSLSLFLSSIISIEKNSGGFTSSPKIVLHLKKNETVYSPNRSYIKLSFGNGGISTFFEQLESTLAKKAWEINTPKLSTPTKVIQTGILGIERSIQAKQRQTDENIGKAFEDLKNLMSLAKEMVTTSRNIANKLRERSTDFNTDETTQLRSYLLGLGIDDPVTKEAIGSSTDYYKQLANEVVTILETQIRHVGGTMLLSEAYCRMNRVRGMHLLSPDDLLNACNAMNNMGLPLRLQTYQSGIYAISLASLEEKNIVETVKNTLHEYKLTGLSVAEFAVLGGCSILLAQERLHLGETHGVVVRDLSLEGVRFYPNLFWYNT